MKGDSIFYISPELLRTKICISLMLLEVLRYTRVFLRRWWFWERFLVLCVCFQRRDVILSQWFFFLAGRVRSIRAIFWWGSIWVGWSRSSVGWLRSRLDEIINTFVIFASDSVDVVFVDAADLGTLLGVYDWYLDLNCC